MSLSCFMRATLYPCLAAAAFIAAPTAFASDTGSPGHLPLCPSFYVDGKPGDACRLVLRNGDFQARGNEVDFLAPWQVIGNAVSARSGPRPNDGVAVLPDAGDAISQRIALPLSSTVDSSATGMFAVRLMARTRAPVAADVSVRLYLSDDTGAHAVALGSATGASGTGTALPIALTVNGQVFPQPAYLNVVIERANAAYGGLLTVDDVSIVQSLNSDVELIAP